MNKGSGQFFLFFVLLMINVSLLPAQTRLEGKESMVLVKADNVPSNNYRPYINAFASIGFHAGQINLSELETYDFSLVNTLVIPFEEAKTLSASLSLKIAAAVNNGLNLITEGISPLSQALGIKPVGKTALVNRIIDSLHPEVEIRWGQSVPMTAIDTVGLYIFCRDRKSLLPAAAGGVLGRGKFIFLPVTMSHPGGFGYERFPYLHEHFLDFFCQKLTIKRNRLVIYVDYGYHDQDNPIELAAKLKSYGVSEVHLSGWYPVERCGDFYKKFIDACHCNGILAYIWLELPMVSDEFWGIHPEWRQFTAQLKEAKLDWRKLMALENPACMQSALNYIGRLIREFEWDGVDLAELYFDSLLGHESPSSFTPMSSYVRCDFKKKYGTDPAELFKTGGRNHYKRNKSLLAKFLNYRADLCTKLNNDVLEFIYAAQKDTHADIYLTQIDNPFNAKIMDAIGVRTGDFIGLQKKYGFTMQAEDPYPLWVMGPERYKKIGEHYRQKLGSQALLTLDINIVEEGRDDPLPTNVQTGLEFTELLREASLYSDRVCIYAANTPLKQDFRFVPYALSTMCTITKMHDDSFQSDSPVSFNFETGIDNPEILVDGQDWPCSNLSQVLLPAGRHKIVIGKNNGTDKLHITGFSGEIESAHRQGNNITILYNEKRNTLLTFSGKPEAVLVNGLKKNLREFFNPETGEYTYLCPAGENSINITEKQR